MWTQLQHNNPKDVHSNQETTTPWSFLRAAFIGLVRPLFMTLKATNANLEL